MDRDYPTLIKDQLSMPIRKRMDIDRELIELKPYVMKDDKGSLIDDVINVTLSLPARLAGHVEAALGNTEEAIIVTSNDNKIDTAYIEDFVRLALAAANDRVIRRGGFPIGPYIDQQLCRRGGAAARVVFQMVDKVMVPDIGMWDRRFVAYGMGYDGLAWAGYPIVQSKDVIESERWAQEIGYTIDVKEAEIAEVWDENENIIYVMGKEVYRQKHPFGFTPCVLQGVSLGSMTADKDSQQYRDEGILFLLRGGMPEFNRLMSILQTLSFKGLNPSWELASQGHQQKPHEDMMKSGVGTSVEIGGGIRLISYGDAVAQATRVHQIWEQEMRSNGLTEIQIGNLEFQLSAIALIELGQSRDQIYRPRLRSKNEMRKSKAEMIIEQVLLSGERQVEIGTRGHKRMFDVKKLEGEYSIEFKHFPKSPTTDMALTALANASAPYFDEQTILEEKLQVRDPAKVMRRKRIDQAMASSILLTKRIQLQALIDEGRDEDARIFAAEVGLTIDQMLAGTMPTLQGQAASQPGNGQKPSPESVLKLLGQGGSRPSPPNPLRPNSAQAASNLQKATQQEV